MSFVRHVPETVRSAGAVKAVHSFLNLPETPRIADQESVDPARCLPSDPAHHRPDLGPVDVRRAGQRRRRRCVCAMNEDRPIRFTSCNLTAMPLLRS